jgi:drug/metabolite transporter (DMT)-like permease
MAPVMSPTTCGFLAIGLWALLALFTIGTGSIPPFQLTAMTFGIASLISLAIVASQGRLGVVFQQPAKVWALGIYGLFGFHALFFMALKLAPPAEATLINYLWPLLIILFTALLPGESLRGRHVLAGLSGLAGVLVLLFGKESISFDAAHWQGYLAAFACALIWSSYSVLSRLVGETPTESVAGFCLASCLLSALAHVLFEQSVTQLSLTQWLSVLALGIGPAGAAFFLWDIGMKRGNIRLLGVASYAAPVLSTLVLVLAGQAKPHWTLLVACLLITGAAMLAIPKRTEP